MVSFVIYEVFLYDKPLQFKDREDKLRLIRENLGDQVYEMVWLRSFYGADEINKVYDLYVNKLRDSYEFETDGMILTVDGDQKVYDEINSRYKISTFNRYNMALKPPAEYAESVIKAIHAYVNRRKVSFVAEIEPVQIMGVNISRATLDNYYNIEKNHIGIGTNCLIKRTNDVIPKIFDTFNKDEGSIKQYELHNCPCCGSKLIRYYKDLVCPNEFGCRDVYKSKIMNVITKLEAKNIGESTVDFITDAIIRKHPGKMYLYNFFSELLCHCFKHQIHATMQQISHFETSSVGLSGDLAKVQKSPISSRKTILESVQIVL
jgi:DNA ligase (NAD+)